MSAMVDNFLRIDADAPRKRCTKCGMLKRMAAFYERPAPIHGRTTLDGLQSHCKRCHVAAVTRAKRKRAQRTAS